MTSGPSMKPQATFLKTQAPTGKPGERIYVKISPSLRTLGSKRKLAIIFLGMSVSICCTFDADVCRGQFQMAVLLQKFENHVTDIAQR